MQLDESRCKTKKEKKMTEENQPNTISTGSLRIKIVRCAWQDYEKLHNEFASTHKIVSTQTHIIDDGKSILSVIYYKE